MVDLEVIEREPGAIALRKAPIDSEEIDRKTYRIAHLGLYNVHKIIHKKIKNAWRVDKVVRIRGMILGTEAGGDLGGGGVEEGDDTDGSDDTDDDGSGDDDDDDLDDGDDDDGGDDGDDDVNSQQLANERR